MIPPPEIRITVLPPAPSFAALPDSWVCPLCGVGKDMFSEE